MRPETSRNGRSTFLPPRTIPYRAALLDDEHAPPVAGRSGRVKTGLSKFPMLCRRRPGRAIVAAGVPVAVAVAVGRRRRRASPWRGPPPPPQPSADNAHRSQSARADPSPKPRMTGAALAPAGRRRRACRVPCSCSRRRTGTTTLGNQNKVCRALSGYETLEEVIELPRRIARQAGLPAEDCTIVLDGAVSQWKRSDGSRAAIGPPSGEPAATRSSVSSWARTPAGSQSGAGRSARSRRAPSSRRGTRAAG